MSTATLTQNATFAPMLPIFDLTPAESIAVAPVAVPSKDEDRELCKAYLTNWGNTYASEKNQSGVSFESFLAAAARLSIED